MTQINRIRLLILMDSIIVILSVFLSFFILESHANIMDPIHIFQIGHLLPKALILLGCHYFFSYYNKLYYKVWEYASVGEMRLIFFLVTASVVIMGIVGQILFQDVSIQRLIVVWMTYLILIGSSRFVWRISRTKILHGSNRKRALIVGAGDAGTLLAHQLLMSKGSEILPVAFIDDDPLKRNLEIYGLLVAGNRTKIDEVVKKYSVQKIVIAIPSLQKKEINELVEECIKTNIKTVIMPSVEDLMLGKVAVQYFRDVNVDDLLGRDPILLDTEMLTEVLNEKVILVTGAGGSIGSEICRQVCSFGPKKILLLGHGENSIYHIDLELRKQYGNELLIIPVIADIQDRERIFEIMETYRPDVVFHAAAHKHVPLMEYNPKEAVKNNVIGTKNVAEAADYYDVNRFVLISSDKAVNPTNVMGSTKRIAEMVIQQLSKRSRTIFTAVRFGNVLGSRGSVIPLFKSQIRAGGPVTVTHPEMTRYFMTIPEASLLVLQAGALAKGGEIFVLDMGEPVNISDLAQNLIRLSGFLLDEIKIEYTGIRPGEKMFEELLNETEINPEAVYPKIFVGKATASIFDEGKVEELINQLSEMTNQDVHQFVLGLANKKEKVMQN